MAKAAAKKTAVAAPSVERRRALAGQELSAGVKLAVLQPAERISLRAPEASVAALSKALGVTLPNQPKTSASKAGRTALWLGPDEWLVIDEAAKTRWPIAPGSRRCIPPSAFRSQCRHRRYRFGGRRDDQFRLSAGSVARRFSGRSCLAHNSGQGRDRAFAYRNRRFPGRMLAFVQRLCLCISVGGGRRRSGVIAKKRELVSGKSQEHSRRRAVCQSKPRERADAVETRVKITGWKDAGGALVRT